MHGLLGVAAKALLCLAWGCTAGSSEDVDSSQPATDAHAEEAGVRSGDEPSGSSASATGTGGEPSPTRSEPSPTKSEPSPTKSEPSPTKGEPSLDATRPTASQDADSGLFRVELEPGLQLLLRPSRSSALLGEPLTLVVSLANGGPDVVRVEDVLAPEYGFLEVLVTDPAGVERVYRTPEHANSRGVRPQPLAAGERIAAIVPLYYSAEGWFLDRTGTYQARARYVPGKTEYRSEPVAFEIRPPASEADARAAALFMDKAAARFFYLSGGVEKLGGAEAMRTIVADHPESHVAGYARLALGRSLSRRTYDADKHVTEPDFEAAARELELALAELEDPVMHLGGSLELSRCYRELGRNEEARTLLSAARSRHAWSESVASLAELLEKP